MYQTLISLGANLGDPSKSVRQAADRLQSLFGAGNSEFRLSGLYRTPPVGGPSGQPPFVNAVIALTSKLDPWEAWSIVRRVETELGRVRQRRWEARRIDVDILLHGEHRIWTPKLKIPHPRMCMRRFILAPANEVAADWIDPVSKFSISQLAQRLDGRPSSLAVIAPTAAEHQAMLQRAVHVAGAKWRMPGIDPPPGSRWVQLIASEDSDSSDHAISSFSNDDRDLLPGLEVHLTPRVDIEGAQWEDIHSKLAIQLGFKPQSSAQKTLATNHANCPRYLLSSDDPDWAAHEIAAALDAMDCPVERITPTSH